MNTTAPDKHYCDICREITYHIVQGMNIVCLDHRDHKKIKWCKICGKRKDLGECEHLDKNNDKN